MVKHLENILRDISKIKMMANIKYDSEEVKRLEYIIKTIIDCFDNNTSIDLNLVNEVDGIIYTLNLNNNFNSITDHISNEYYAFEFMLEEKLNE